MTAVAFKLDLDGQVTVEHTCRDGARPIRSLPLTVLTAVPLHCVERIVCADCGLSGRIVGGEFRAEATKRRLRKTA